MVYKKGNGSTSQKSSGYYTMTQCVLPYLASTPQSHMASPRGNRRQNNGFNGGQTGRCAHHLQGREQAAGCCAVEDGLNEGCEGPYKNGNGKVSSPSRFERRA